MINVDFDKVEIGISKKLKDSIPMFDMLYELSPDACKKATVAQDLETLFIALIHKYGFETSKHMVLLALARAIGNSDNPEVTEITKETKDHE